MTSRIRPTHPDTNVLLDEGMSIVAAVEYMKELKRLGDELDFRLTENKRVPRQIGHCTK